MMETRATKTELGTCDYLGSGAVSSVDQKDSATAWHTVFVEDA